MFRIKKSCYILAIVLVALFLIVCSFFAYRKNISASAEGLKGQWKVTELVEFCRSGTTYWAEETYLGRSIEISDKRVKKSIYFWPSDQYKKDDNYEFCRNERISVDKFFAKAGLLNSTGWHDSYKNEMVNYITLYKNKDDFDNGFFFDEYAIFQDGNVYAQFFDGWYKIEPYIQACTDIEIDDLFGKWIVKRLVSYEEGWIGNRALLEFNKGQIEMMPELKNWKEAEGIDFQVKEYYGDMLQIEPDRIYLQSETGIKDEHNIVQFETYRCNKRNYQYVKGIHDELGLTNDIIQVVTGIYMEKNDQSLLDGEIVVIDNKSIIMKIESGWYLLEKVLY